MGPRAVGEARVDGWMWDEDGVRLYDLTDTIKISEPVRDKFDGYNKEKRHLSHSVHFRNTNSIVTIAPDSDGVYRNLLNYQYPIDDTRTGWYSEIKLPTSSGADVFDFQHMAEVEDENGDFHLYVGDKNGMLYELFAEDALNWGRVSGGDLPITQKFAPAYLRLGALGVETYGVTGAIRPFDVEVRINTVSNKDVTIKVTLETADGSDDGTRTRDDWIKDFVFPAGVSIQRYPVPEDMQPGEFLRFTAENSDTDVDLTILGVRVSFDVVEGQYPIDGPS